MAEATCSIDDCPNRASSRGWCRKHYTRWKRHGDPLALMIGKGVVVRRLNSSGYYLLNDVGHPLASGNGSVYEHRAVLYDAIGPGWHKCFYCTTDVCWEHRWPKDRDALTVDHLDGDKLNNDPTNLVPCCAPCNTKEQAKRLVGDTCRRGHPVNEINTYVNAQGRRTCRVCRRMYRPDVPAERRNIYGSRRKAA